MPQPSLDALRTSNKERAYELAKKGVTPIVLADPILALKFRLDVLTDFLIADKRRDEFELHFERELEELIALAEQSAAKTILTQGRPQAFDVKHQGVTS